MADVKILSGYCKGCGYCIKNCPKKILEVGSEMNELGYRFTVPAHPENCIACGICAVTCPDSAIEVFK